MCGPDAFANGQDTKCINVYTSRVAVRDALSPEGDFMATHTGVDQDELCVLSIALGEFYQQLISAHCPKSCELRRIVKPTEFIVLDANLHPVSSMDLAVLAAG